MLNRLPCSTFQIVLEGCDKPPAEVPDMDEKNEYGMAGKLWDEYCENLLINHMRQGLFFVY